MKHNLLTILIISLLSATLYGQNDTITITMNPPLYQRVVLYATEGAQQKYLSHYDTADGQFKITMPKNANHAMYRLVYNPKTMDYLDFFYLGKPVSFSFNPKAKNPLPQFADSPENKRYYEKLIDIYTAQEALDSMQVQLFQPQSERSKKKLIKKYRTSYKDTEAHIKTLLDGETNVVIRDVLRSFYRVLPGSPIIDPADYLSFVRRHYFDHVDFNNINLIHSSVLADKVLDYIFYLTVAENPKKQNALYKETIDHVMSRMSNDLFRRSFMQSLIQSFGREENVEVVDHIFNKHYNKLPSGLQNPSWRSQVLYELSTAVTRQAKNINIKTKDKGLVSLYNMHDADYYVVVFWSTSCPHCLIEIPKLYDYLKDESRVKVIAVGLEDEYNEKIWQSQTLRFPNFLHVVGLGKWDSQVAKDYNIHSTPNYFVLNKTKMIIAKPYDFKAIKKYFEAKLKTEDAEDKTVKNSEK